MKYRLADVLLREQGHEGLEAFVRELRKAGNSWRIVSFELYKAINLDIEHQGLTARFRELDRTEWSAASAPRRP